MFVINKKIRSNLNAKRLVLQVGPPLSMIFFEADINLEDKVTVLTLLVSQTQVNQIIYPLTLRCFPATGFPEAGFFTTKLN